MDMKEEMMNDAIDDVIGDEEDDEERLVRLGDFLGTFFISWIVKPDKGGMVVSWLVCLTLDQAVQVWALAADTVVFMGKTVDCHSVSTHPAV